MGVALAGVRGDRFDCTRFLCCFVWVVLVMGYIYTKKVVIDDIKFDSQMEADYYLLLKERLNKGEIKNLKIHPRYELQPKYTNAEGKKVEAIYYEADFEYNEKGKLNIVVVDVKGMITDDFALKWKMFDYKFGNGNFLYSSLQVLKYSKATGWVNYEDYKKIKKSMRQKAISEKNEYKRKLELLPRLRTLQEKLDTKGKLTEKETARLEYLKNELKEYL